MEMPTPETLDAGRYSIEKVLGMGGTAVVLLALDTRMGVHRAIKLLHPRFSASAESRARLKREAHAQAALKHPNVLMVHDVVEDDQGVYLVMELAESDSLGKRISQAGPLSPREVAEVGVAIGGALAEAHASGLVHRDVKPANILVDKHGVYKLADFGIARDNAPDLELTRDGMVMGTWAFMPPEQRESTRDADTRSDIYAFGVTLYALLTNRQNATLHNQESWSESFAGVDPRLALVIQRATRLYPEHRYQRIEELVADLKLFLESPGAGADVAISAPPPAQTAETPSHSSGARLTAVPVSSQTWNPVPTAPPATGSIILDPPPRSKLPAILGTAIGALLVGSLGLMAFFHWGPKAFETPLTPTASDQLSAPIPPPPVAPEQGTPPAGASPTASESTTTSSKEPVESARGSSTEPSTATGKGTRRVITVLSTDDPKGAESSTAATEPSTPQATGTVHLRTVPSGATVSLRGRAIAPSSAGTYTLPVGSHTLELKSVTGEKTRLAVSVKAGESVELCYSFDTNSACGGAR